jgi:hypothetical protein
VHLHHDLPQGAYKGLVGVEYATTDRFEWYNNSRLHSAIGWQSPIAFENAYYPGSPSRGSSVDKRRRTRSSWACSATTSTHPTFSRLSEIGEALRRDDGRTMTGHARVDTWATVADALIRRRPDVAGVVAHGDHRGRELGFPTANIHVPHLRHGDGVYAGLVLLPDGRRHLAAISIGTRPTYWGKYGARLLEAHLLDFCGDLYGSRLKVWLSTRLRDQIAFTSESGLVAQMRIDIEEVEGAGRRCRSTTSHSPTPDLSP